MNGFTDARDVIVGKLVAAGVDAGDDPRLVPPGVLVGPPDVTGRSGIGAWTAVIPVTIVAPPPGDAAALDWMLETLEVVLVATASGLATVGTYELGGKTCPAYTVPVVVSVPDPNC